MPKSSIGNRLQRLEELRGLLRAKDHATIPELSAELGVSPRTLSRDIALLRESGDMIDGDPGRGGGIQLRQRWSSGGLRLDYEEAVDLLLSMTIAERIGSPLLLKRVSSIRRKLTAAFADAHLERIKSLRKRILIGGPASPQVLTTYKSPTQTILAPMTRAFFEMRRLRMRYRAQGGELTDREVELHYLYFNPPVWYLLAWDLLRSDVRFFRIDRVWSADVLATTFRMRQERKFLIQAEHGAEPL